MAQRNRVLGYLRALLFPPKCSACNALLDWKTPHAYRDTDALCASCFSKWEEEERVTCERCGKALRECLCMPVLIDSVFSEGLFKLVHYEPHNRTAVQNRVIYHIKENNDLKTPAFLASRLYPAIAAEVSEKGIRREDMIFTYLPRGRRALLKHGTDQARSLATELARLFDAPVEPLVERLRGADQVQKQLSYSQRIINAKRSFAAIEGKVCTGKTVFLVDDIVTTGAGMAFCTRHVYGLDAKAVYGVAIAIDAVNKEHAASTKKEGRVYKYKTKRPRSAALKKTPENGEAFAKTPKKGTSSAQTQKTRGMRAPKSGNASHPRKLSVNTDWTERVTGTALTRVGRRQFRAAAKEWWKQNSEETRDGDDAQT